MPRKESHGTSNPVGTMEIYFCDLCNESVPQGDLERGRARMRNGRVICEACEAAMSPESEGSPPGAPQPAVPGPAAGATERAAAPRPSSDRATAVVSVVLASLALLVAVGGAATVFALLDGRFRTLDGSLTAADQARRDEARALTQEWRRDLGGLEERLARMGSEDASARERLGSLGERLESGLAALAGLREDVGRASDRTELLGTRVEERHLDQLAELELLTGRTRDLEAEFLKLAARFEADQAQPPATTVPDVAALATDEPPAWLPLLADLKSQSSGTRWQAVQELGASGDVAVAEHLTPMLNDPDIFVRMATARILGDLGAVVGIPALIDALEDPEASVREAAVVSLRGISKQDFRFNPGGKDAERAKRVKAWRDWWSRASEELLGR